MQAQLRCCVTPCAHRMRSHHHSVAGVVAKPEIADYKIPCRVDEQVVRLDVSMEAALRMKISKEIQQADKDSLDT